MNNLKKYYQEMQPNLRALLQVILVLAVLCLVSEEARNALFGLD